MFNFNHVKHMVAASALVFFAVSASNPVEAKTMAKKITSVEGITEYQLNNGLRVLLFPEQTKETVTVNIT